MDAKVVLEISQSVSPSVYGFLGGGRERERQEEPDKFELKVSRVLKFHCFCSKLTWWYIYLISLPFSPPTWL